MVLKQASGIIRMETKPGVAKVLPQVIILTIRNTTILANKDASGLEKRVFLPNL